MKNSKEKASDSPAKKYKGLLVRIIPIVLVILLTVALSEIFYQSMMQTERENCWEELATARREVSREIGNNLQNHFKILDLAADAIILNVDFEDEETVLSYLESVRQETIFDRLDVVYPDGTILVPSETNPAGERVKDPGMIPYTALAGKGTHMSRRVVDYYTGQECVYAFSVVWDTNDKPLAVLEATLYCSTLAETFGSAYYGDAAKLFLVDLRDGSIVLDNWHDSLGSVNDLQVQPTLDAEEDFDFITDLLAGNAGQASLVSGTNGKNSYLSYAKVTDTNYALILMVQEDVVFSAVSHMKNTLMKVGVVEAVLLLFFLLWIYWIALHAARIENRAREAEYAYLQQKEEELQLQYEEAASRQDFLEAMSVNLPGGYHRCSTENGFVLSFVSNSFLEITGYTREQLETEVNNCYIHLVAPEDREYFLSLEPTLAKEGRIDCAYRIVRRDGSLRWVQDSTQKIERDGERYYQCTLADIHEIVHTLNEAKKAAEESSMAKTTFLFNASHDIRTPMNAILGFAHILEQNADDPTIVRDTIAKISQAGQTLMTLLNDVLELSRIERGKEELHLEAAALSEQNRNLYEMLAGDMEAAGIEFTKEEKITHDHVLCDPVKLSRIGMNLLSNARKFTPRGGKVTFGVEEQFSEGESATYRFFVKDTGIGMSQEFQARAFGQFERERTATESGVTGSGLGLSITKRLVDLMGGVCTIDSEPGRGTEISVCLTFSLADEPQALVAPTGSADMTGKRVLLVEDNEFNREIARCILEGMHFVVEEATDGAVCVDMLQQPDGARYDLVLMDIQMPRMDGYAATQVIRQMKNPAAASVPIIAMTANAFEEDRQKCLAMGMNGHIGKPIEVEALVKELARVLE